MNAIYLMRDEKRNFCLYKVGYTQDLDKRVNAYTTHNPLVECISFVFTQKRSKREVEKMFHEEIKSMGYTFITAEIDGKMTEWFKVDYTDPLYEALNNKGLNAFKCGKGRKCYTMAKAGE